MLQIHDKLFLAHMILVHAISLKTFLQAIVSFFTTSYYKYDDNVMFLYHATMHDGAKEDDTVHILIFTL